MAEPFGWHNFSIKLSLVADFSILMSQSLQNVLSQKFNFVIFFSLLSKYSGVPEDFGATVAQISTKDENLIRFFELLTS